MSPKNILKKNNFCPKNLGPFSGRGPRQGLTGLSLGPALVKGVSISFRFIYDDPQKFSD